MLEIIEINGVKYQKVQKKGKEVVVRTYSSGVHVGELKSQSGTEVELVNARRLWKWAGAFTLNEVATKGVNRSESRISCAVPEIKLLEAIEIIPISGDVDLSPTE